MNTKTYNLAKYISTIGAVLLFTGPLLVFLSAWKDIFKGHDDALIGVSLTLTLLGVILIGVYLAVRWHLKKKTAYQHTPKDLKLLYFSMGAYLGGAIFSLVMTILGLTLNSDRSIMIAFAPLYTIELILLVVASILESMSRIDEQIYLYQQENVRQENLTPSEAAQQAYSEKGIKRTKEAQDLLQDQLVVEVDPSLKNQLQTALDESDVDHESKK